MSYVVDRPHGPALRLAQVAAVIVCVIGFVFVPYALIAGTFWGADLGLIILHILEISVAPAAAIPISFAKAKKFAEEGRARKAAFVRFIPILLQVVVGPLLMFATSRVWWALS